MVTASLSSNMYKKAVWRDCLAFESQDKSPPILLPPTSDIFVSFYLLLFFTCFHAASRPVLSLSAATSLLVLKDASTSMTKSHILEPAFEDLISDSAVLCETEDCFLHVQHIDTKTGLPKMRKMTSKVFVEIFKMTPQSQNLEIDPICINYQRFSHDNTA